MLISLNQKVSYKIKLTLSLEQRAVLETSAAENHSVFSHGGRFKEVGSPIPLFCDVSLLNEKMGSMYF